MGWICFSFNPPYSSRARHEGKEHARRGAVSVKRIKAKFRATFAPLNGLAMDGEPRACEQEQGPRSAASPLVSYSPVRRHVYIALGAELRPPLRRSQPGRDAIHQFGADVNAVNLVQLAHAGGARDIDLGEEIADDIKPYKY